MERRHVGCLLDADEVIEMPRLIVAAVDEAG
jgi:hypothetical protein